MLKQIATVSLLTLTLTGCVSPAEGTPIIAKSAIQIVKNPGPELLEKVQLGANTTKIQNMIQDVKKHVGKTWYVFSGNTPSGWDCSGLTMWAYEQIGITLEHRASKQQTVGEKAVEPLPGDIVVFTYKGYKSAYHVGIYIGDGLMIHAPRKGEVTRIESVTEFGGNYSKVSYRRILQTL
jgi:cell wall-associated NlpC family hydrolase